MKIIQALAVYSAPFVPRAVDRIWGYLGNEAPLEWSKAQLPLEEGRELPDPSILFEKIELGETESS
jgi:methionyl-tRNA synthetase